MRHAPDGAAARLAAEARRVLERNWREGLRSDGRHYAYTCPAVPRYRHQWYWDSCFHAIAWSRLDAARARAELRTLLSAGRSDGFVPHTVFWGDAPGWRRAPLYATEKVRGSLATASTGPPLLAFAWEIVARASPDDPGFALEAVRALRAHHNWFLRERDPDRDGLVTILLPDESGLDDSPKYDGVFRGYVHWGPGYFALVERCRRARWDAAAIAAGSDLHVEDVWMNVALALSAQALARLSGAELDARPAHRIAAALLERSWDARRGLFLDLAGRGERPVGVSTWSSLTPLLLGDLIPEELRRRLVEEHLLHPLRYGACCGIPSVSMEEPSFRAGFSHFRTWRGPAWVNTAWLLLGPLRDLGYDDAADQLAGGMAAAVLRGGLREYYDPLTGAGLGARDFGWSALAPDLAVRESIFTAR